MINKVLAGPTNAWSVSTCRNTVQYQYWD